MKSRSIIVISTLVLILVSSATLARADLSRKQTRKLIARMVGLTLSESSVRVRQVAMTGTDHAEATAEVELVFRLAQNEQGSWRISEVRTGQGRWEDLDTIAQAARFELSSDECDKGSPLSAASQLTAKRARCLIASLFHVELPSDAVRIKEVSPLGLPFGSRQSGLAVSLVRLDFQLAKSPGGWRVVALKSGNGMWQELAGVPAALDSIKRIRATEELNLMARALDAFHKDRGTFVVSEKQAVLIDHLSPRYLGRVIRVDPWHNPYEYLGDSDHFTLRSLGPDGKANTGDDLVVSNSGN